jgi:hypothetical protein
MRTRSLSLQTLSATGREGSDGGANPVPAGAEGHAWSVFAAPHARAYALPARAAGRVVEIIWKKSEMGVR